MLKVFLKEKTVNKVKGSVFIGLFLLGVFALSMGVTDDHSSYTRIMMHELEKEIKSTICVLGLPEFIVESIRKYWIMN